MGEMVTDAGWLKSGFEIWSNWNLRKDKKRTRLGMRRMGRPLRLLKLLQVYHFTDSSKVCELDITTEAIPPQPTESKTKLVLPALVSDGHCRQLSQRRQAHVKHSRWPGPADRVYSMQLLHLTAADEQQLLLTAAHAPLPPRSVIGGVPCPSSSSFPPVCMDQLSAGPELV